MLQQPLYWHLFCNNYKYHITENLLCFVLTYDILRIGLARLISLLFPSILHPQGDPGAVSRVGINGGKSFQERQREPLGCYAITRNRRHFAPAKYLARGFKLSRWRHKESST